MENTKEVKKLLQSYRWAMADVDRYTEMLREIVYSMDSTSGSDNDGMPHGTKISDPTSDMAIRLADIKNKLVDAKVDAIDKRIKAYEAICALPEGANKKSMIKIYEQIGGE